LFLALTGRQIYLLVGNFGGKHVAGLPVNPKQVRLHLAADDLEWS